MKSLNSKAFWSKLLTALTSAVVGPHVRLEEVNTGAAIPSAWLY
jgi:hypothetical protein